MIKIKWYQTDPRFTPGTVADIGDIRLYLRMTDRAKNNKWRLYMSIRTRPRNGVEHLLKREVCVAQWDATLTLAEVQYKATAYLCDFLAGIIKEIT